MIREIGKGNFRVYLYERISDNKLCAVKSIDAKNIQAKFGYDEIECLKKLDHENIIQFIDFIKEEIVCYIVTEYVDGKSL